MKTKSVGDLSLRRCALLIVGSPGVGKTYLASTLPDHKRVLFISVENGTLCLSDHKDIQAVTIDPNAPFKDSKMNDDKDNPMYSITQIFLFLMKDEYKARYDYIFFDSITEIGELILADLKRDPIIIASKNGYDIWNKYSERMTTIIKMFRDFKPYSVIFTCLNEMEKDGVSFREDFKVPMAGIRNSLQGWFDLVLKYEIIEIEEKKYRKLISDTTINPLAKDRSGKLSKYEDPHLGKIMNKILGDNHGKN